MSVQGINMLANTSPSSNVNVAYWLYSLEDSVWGESGFIHIINPGGKSYNYIQQKEIVIISPTHAKAIADVVVDYLAAILTVEVYIKDGVIHAGYSVYSKTNPNKLLDCSAIIACEPGSRLRIIGKPEVLKPAV